MLPARQSSDHARIRRDFVKLTLEERAPKHIKIPVPLLGPILDPLLGPAPTPNATPAPNPTPNPTPDPTPTPPTPPPPTTTPDNGGGNGGGGSPPGGTPSSSPGNGGNPGGNTSDSGGGSSSSPQPTSGSGKPGGNGTGSSSANGSSPTDANGQSLDTNSNGGGPVANAGSNPNPNSTSSGSGGGLHSVIATTSGKNGANPTSLLNPTNSDNSGGPDGSVPHDTAATSKGMSTGAIAAVAVIVSLFFLALLVFLLRKRYISRRSERRNRWWSRAEASGAYGDSNTPAPASNRSRASVRSSFATTVDHAQSPRLTVDFAVIPSLPPMAEIRGGHGAQLFGAQSPVSPVVNTPILVSIDSPKMDNRNSLRSIESNNSDTQYLVVPNSNLLDAPSTPMSVRPFSPSESFAFPKPPNQQTQSGDWSSTRPLSSATVNTTLSSGASAPIPPTPALSANPFADPSRPNADFADTEHVRRPFIPTRHDELEVAIGDSVKVTQLFDDGWALVERLPPFETVLENAKNGVETHGARGLIPIDCFRAPGQDLPSFFYEKRVSVPYQGSDHGYTVTAM